MFLYADLLIRWEIAHTSTVQHVQHNNNCSYSLIMQELLLHLRRSRELKTRKLGFAVPGPHQFCQIFAQVGWEVWLLVCQTMTQPNKIIFIGSGAERNNGNQSIFWYHFLVVNFYYLDVIWVPPCHQIVPSFRRSFPLGTNLSYILYYSSLRHGVYNNIHSFVILKHMTMIIETMLVTNF